MQPAEVTEWLNLAVRWTHVIAAIMWIGSSLFFNWLDPRIEQNERTRAKKIEGELWMVHSGGFYQVEKKLVAPVPEEMPQHLHWFKWEAAFTLLSGWLLLDIVFFQGGGVTLVDPNVSNISPTTATAVVIGGLIGMWFVYDLLWRSPLVKNVYVGAIITYAIVVGVLFHLSHLLSGRAAYLVTGAMMGTWMATNVWVHIIPAQKGLVASVTSRQPPDPKLAKHAKTRSRHNNYFTYPVILIMLSNHFPGLYGSKHAPLVLAVLILVGAGIRHLQNTVKNLSPAVLITVLATLLVVTHSKLTSQETASTEDVSTAKLTASEPSATGGPKQVANESVVGTIKAKVVLEGTPPPPKDLNLGTCTTEAKGPVKSDAVLVQDGKLQNAFVWIKSGLDGYKAPPPPAEPIVMDQHGCLYKPHVIGARVGQKVIFLNSDPVLHNVRTVADQNAPFNDMMPTKDMRLSKTFDKPEVMVRAKCDVHPWMAAFVGVVDHPFFAVSNAAGEITLQNVPEGDYEVEAWHEVFGRQSQKVKVAARKTESATFTFKTVP